MESTFDSMRSEFRAEYDALKKTFIVKNLGIYDTTTDIEDTIALSDAYIGDAGTSVIALFGVAGEPIFILNNQILEEPGRRTGERKFPHILIIRSETGLTSYKVANCTYPSQDAMLNRYFCKLADEDYRKCYFTVNEINGKLYACSYGTSDIFIIGKRGVEKKIA